MEKEGDNEEEEEEEAQEEEENSDDDYNQVGTTEFLCWGSCKLEQGILVCGFRNMYNYHLLYHFDFDTLKFTLVEY